MTTLHAIPYNIPAAAIGPENPLPMFRGLEDDARMNADPAMPEEDRRYFGWRTTWRALPYRMQDSYNRNKRMQGLPSLVLENAHLRATFLPNRGGRLVSLYHKAADRELLDRNPVFQPANLALRNAWFSGGIEWNAGGLPGHHYRTCSSVIAAQVEGTAGEPVLRLYEWDRVLGFPWQIDFHLPPDSPFLFAHVRLVNPHDHELPMYWWTNIAVTEREDVRVLVPAETAICNAYRGGLELIQLPNVGGRDLTYSTQSLSAFDFFSRIPEGRRRWIAALDGKGRGLFEASTSRLRGRKLFCWGMSQGGRRWQEFLAAPGSAYIEIQAGLAQTQMECIPMPARTEWTWTEAFGLLQADPGRVHGADWQAAWQAAGEEIERLLPVDDLAACDSRFAKVREQAPTTSHQSPASSHSFSPTPSPRPPTPDFGSGWGALERKRREAQGSPSPFPAALPFEDSTLGEEQAPWLALLQTGALPQREPHEEPGALMTQPEWAALLEESVKTPAGDHWLAWWHLGNARMEARDLDGARTAWEISLQRRTTGWALRNLSVLANRQGDRAHALDLMRQAWETGPPVAALAVEYAQLLLSAGHYAEALDFARQLPPGLREHERIRLAWARAALETGDLEGIESLFDYDFATIREGEVSLTDLWFGWHERRLAAAENIPLDAALKQRVRREFPPPRHIDFRMAASEEG